jgi:hypothetical protein
MKQRIKNILLALTIALTGGLTLVPAIASADLKGDACEGVNALSGSSSSTCDPNADKSVNRIFRTVIQIFSIVVGFVAVVMVIIGGLKYITANGDSGAMASARTTIIYALVGLVIVAVAQILVHFVIKKI